MKIRYKLLLVFLGALTLSMTLFLFLSYYCLNKGYFSGISHDDMRAALVKGEQILPYEASVIGLQELENSYKDMDFALLTNDGWESLEDVPVLKNAIEVMNAVNGQMETCREYEVLATALVKENQTVYLVCFVNKLKFEAMTYKFNMARAEGMLGKLAIVGIIMTLFMMGIAAYFFQREYEEKERYEKHRKELISNLSHDLRTPLSSVLGYSEMLKNGIYDNEVEQQNYIDIIYRKTIYMEKLLTELLEYSRLELGTIQLQKQKMDIAELVREILIEYYPEIEKNQYSLELEIPECPIVGMWDKEKLSRVLRNLFDNALKYGMDGKKLRIAMREKQNQVYLEIQDYGKGIPQKEIPHVTEQFYRADHARNSKQGGMGLGLFIVQELIKLHNGSFSIESREQNGMKIYIRIPM